MYIVVCVCIVLYCVWLCVHGSLPSWEPKSIVLQNLVQPNLPKPFGAQPTYQNLHQNSLPTDIETSPAPKAFLTSRPWWTKATKAFYSTFHQRIGQLLILSKCFIQSNHDLFYPKQHRSWFLRLKEKQFSTNLWLSHALWKTSWHLKGRKENMLRAKFWFFDTLRKTSWRSNLRHKVFTAVINAN